MGKSLREELWRIVIDRDISTQEVADRSHMNKATIDRFLCSGKANLSTVENIFDTLGYELTIKEKVDD